LKTWEAESRPKPHDLLLAQRDFERARGLYEPISGFSKVSQRLEQLDRDEEQQQAVEAAREKAQRAAASHKRTGYVRRWR
jgi:hypothetical protein